MDRNEDKYINELLSLVGLQNTGKKAVKKFSAGVYEMSKEEYMVVREVFHLDWVEEGAEIGELIIRFWISVCFFLVYSPQFLSLLSMIADL